MKKASLLVLCLCAIAGVGVIASIIDIVTGSSLLAGLSAFILGGNIGFYLVIKDMT